MAACAVLITTIALLTIACTPAPHRDRPGAAAPNADRVVIPLLLHDDMLYVRSHVNGTDAGMFLIDTGSALTVIGQGVAARLGLPKTRSGTALGVGGFERFTFRRVESLTIGGFPLAPRQLAGISMTRFQKPFGVAVNGIIGFPALADFAFTIDSRQSTLTLVRPRVFQPPPKSHAQPFWIRAGLPHVEAELHGGRRVPVLLDTGAHNDITLPLSLLLRWPDVVAVPSTAAGRSVGVGGEVSSLRTWLVSLRLLGKQLKHMQTSFAAPTAGRRDADVGRVGNNLLKHFRLTFDAETQTVWAQWQPLEDWREVRR